MAQGTHKGASRTVVRIDEHGAARQIASMAKAVPDEKRSFFANRRLAGRGGTQGRQKCSRLQAQLLAESRRSRRLRAQGGRACPMKSVVSQHPELAAEQAARGTGKSRKQPAGLTTRSQGPSNDELRWARACGVGG